MMPWVLNLQHFQMQLSSSVIFCGLADGFLSGLTCEDGFSSPFLLCAKWTQTKEESA